MMTPARADAHRSLPAAYVHIPFCSAVCPYCDFAVVAGRDDLVDRYVEAVCREISDSDPFGPLAAVYFGGGTPSHIPAAKLAQILDVLDRKHGLENEAELSLEANPEDFTLEHGAALNSAGFNRVSFGAQSFDHSVLVALGRRHGPGQIELAVSAARSAGFGNLSMDLIYGSPAETGESWEETLRSAVATEPDHISCYALTVEPGTPLAKAVSAGAASPDPDTQAQRYETAERLLSQAGFARYEVSNWSKPGRECRYNMIVWAQGEYDAYGNGAHGHRDGHRYRNLRRIDSYLSVVETSGVARAGVEAVAGWDAEIERVFVGLRRVVGVAPGPGTRAFVESEDGARLMDAGVITLRQERLVIERPLLTDAVNRALLDTSPPQSWAEHQTPDNVPVRADA